VDIPVRFAGGFDDAWRRRACDLELDVGGVDRFQGFAQVAAVEGDLGFVAFDAGFQGALVVAHFGAGAFDEH